MHSLAEEPAPQDRLDVSEPSDTGLSVQVHQIVDAVAGSNQGTALEARLVCNSTSHEVFLFPWEEDLPASPWEEASGLGRQTLLKCQCRRLFRPRLIVHPRRHRA